MANGGPLSDPARAVDVLTTFHDGAFHSYNSVGPQDEYLSRLHHAAHANSLPAGFLPWPDGISTHRAASEVSLIRLILSSSPPQACPGALFYLSSGHFRLRRRWKWASVPMEERP